MRITEHILRIICGLFLLPEAYGKFSHFPTLNSDTVAFFGKVGFYPAEFWVYFVALGEVTCGVALIPGICTRYVALGAMTILLCALTALNINRGYFAWSWIQGGDEYLAFWAICCLIIAIYGFKHAGK